MGWYDLLSSHRMRILEMVQERLSNLGGDVQGGAEPSHEIILEEFSEMLKNAGGDYPSDDVSLKAAPELGVNRANKGLSPTQLVHDYGVICDSLSQLAKERGLSISPEEWRCLNLAIDYGIAAALNAYVDQTKKYAAHDIAQKLGFYAHEMRNALNAAMMAFDGLTGRGMPVTGRTGQVLGRSLGRLETFISNMVDDIQLDAPNKFERHEQSIGTILQMSIESLGQEKARRVRVSGDVKLTAPLYEHLAVSAVSNLLQNALKYCPSNADILVRIIPRQSFISVEVEDACGGLNIDDPKTLLEPFVRGRTRIGDGIGLGLNIVNRIMDMHNGNVVIQDLPGKGCIFTLNFLAIKKDS